jgi:hypothetical protein
VQHDASRAGKAERAKDGACVDRGTSEKSEGANKKAKEEVGGLGWAAVLRYMPYSGYAKLPTISFEELRLIFIVLNSSQKHRIRLGCRMRGGR